jgi:hypothetical protein
VYLIPVQRAEQSSNYKAPDAFHLMFIRFPPLSYPKTLDMDTEPTLLRGGLALRDVCHILADEDNRLTVHSGRIKSFSVSHYPAHICRPCSRPSFWIARYIHPLRLGCSDMIRPTRTGNYLYMYLVNTLQCIAFQILPCRSLVLTKPRPENRSRSGGIFTLPHLCTIVKIHTEREQPRSMED